ncbi:MULTISPECIES: Uma2 family endonuclease [Nostoc]|uniref:Uma2 family endonuclease n=1 Tax=Nostoc paludosum FACHB-159 TaxID=2692908 RepID=A0ABR8K9A8_9NOSO|nr:MULTISPECIES: Uma2 family endonuclease [Nostoc]MBD2679821.1 Uma2 family endonuclease [Nostoc sp. FACHB-857]MBD2736070.1 Uma2 family endonuclease [Nostoc paludosum FACHB-159]
MVKSDPRQSLPSSAELPCSDDTPVDNEDQNFIPNLLLFLLQYIWADRNDWFFSVDMGVYHTTGVSPLVPIVPDGFLSLGVERRKAGKSRKSYVLWEENEIPPILALEIVSLTPGGEYDKKLDIYAKLGVLYYVIYNPEYWQRDRHQPFEVYRLVDGSYQLQIGEPFWMPEIGLGIGRGQYVSGNIPRQVLYWYDRQGDRYQTPEEIEQQTRQQLELVQKQLEQYRKRFGDLPE